MRAQTIAGLRYQQNDPGVMATRRFFAEGFAGHPYGRPTSGTIESVAAITPRRSRGLHRAVLADGPREDRRRRRDRRRAPRRAPSTRSSAGCRDAAPLRRCRRAEVCAAATRIVVDLDVPQSVIRFGTARRALARSRLHPGLRAQPHPRRRRLHLAAVPGSAREARPRLQRRHVARQLSRRRDDLGLHGDEERARRARPRGDRRRDGAA